MADGSLKFDTKMNNKGFADGIDSMSSKATKGMEQINLSSRMSFAEMASKSGKTVEQIKADVDNLAKEYQQKYGMNIPNSYKKAYKDMGLASKEVQKEVSKDVKKIEDDNKESSKETEKAWKSCFSAAGIAAKGLGVATKATAAIGAGLGVASAVVGALSKSSIEAYADYEQLVGGVETLFGAGGKDLKAYADSVGKTCSEVKNDYFKLMDAQEAVLENADNAYKTAGLSANEYMETVTSFSASLLQSLGGDTEAAAKKADMAITDMADNANKMGSSMESIQNAYQGFAKQNYTMLDNLKLGYGGTKEEMQRLLSDAEKISGKKFDLSSYADVVDAIHVIQTEMGITGTTAKEAASTISGSIGMMKGAWENFLTGMADPEQDFDKLLDNLIDSVLTVADNLVPRIVKTVPRLVDGLGDLIVGLSSYIPELMQDLLPSVIEGASELLSVLVESAPEIFSIFGEVLPELINAIAALFPQIVTALYSFVVDSGGQLLTDLITGMTEKLPELMEKATELLFGFADTIRNGNSDIVSTGIQMIGALLTGIAEKLPELLVAAVDLIIAFVSMIFEHLPEILAIAGEIVAKLIEGLIASIPKLITGVLKLIESICKAFNDTDWLSIGANILNGIWEGLKAGWSWLIDNVKSIAGSLFDAAKEALDIHSPSKKFEYVGEMCVEGMDEPLEDYNPYDTLRKSMKANIGTMKADFENGVGGSSSNMTNQTFNIYQPVKSASEMMRAAKLEAQYDMAGV